MSRGEINIFEHLAAFDDSGRVAARQAVAVAHKRVSDYVGAYLKTASDDEREARLALASDGIDVIIASVVEEYGGDPVNIREAVMERVAAPLVKEAIGLSPMHPGNAGEGADIPDNRGAGPAGCGRCGGDGAPVGVPCPECHYTGGSNPDPSFDDGGEQAYFDRHDPSYVNDLTGYNLEGDGEGRWASIREARRPKMCPYHSELVDSSLQAGEPQYAAFSSLVGGPSHCKGGFDGSCNFKPEMVTQSYWDGKQQEYAERAQQREIERSQPAPIENVFDPEGKGDGIIDLSEELDDAPSAVGEGAPSEHFNTEPEMAMAARVANDEDDDDDKCDECGASTADGEGYDGLCGNCADKAEREGRWSSRQAGGHKPGCECGFCKNKGKGFGNDADGDGEDDSEESNEITAASAPDGAGGAVKRESLPKGDESGLGGPSPKIDKRKWTPQNVKKDVDGAEMNNSPHPTEGQDIKDKPSFDNDLHSIDSVTERQDLPTADDSGQSTERNVSGQDGQSSTWSGTGGQANPVTQQTISSANPLEQILESGFATSSEVTAAIAQFESKD